MDIVSIAEDILNKAIKMKDRDLIDFIKIKIDIEKTGAGAQQAKQELDQLKDSATQASGKLSDVGNEADKTGSKASELRFKLHGFNAILGGVTQLARGGVDAFSGLSRAISGVVMVLSNTVWGRLAQIAAVIVSLGFSIYTYFRPAQEEIKKTDDALKNLDKTQRELAEPVLRTAAEYAKQLADEFDRAADAAARTRKNTDELSSAELALKLAMIDRDVSSGKITEEQGKQQRIEARLANDQDKNNREKLDVQNQIAAAEKNIADARETYESVQKTNQQDQANYIKRQVDLAEKFPLLRSASQDYGSLLKQAKTPEEKGAVLELNALKQETEMSGGAVHANASTYYSAQAKYAPIVESGKSRIQTLDTLSQASQITASAQSMDVSKAITQRQVEDEKKRLAEISAAEQSRQAILADHEKKTFGEEKAGALSTAQQIVEQQRAEEQGARYQLTGAEHAVGAKGLSSRQRAQAKQDLESARSVYGKESADVSQSKALQAKLRSAVDPADVAKLLQALETIGQAFKTVADTAANQASQMKNGGTRTK